MKTLSKTKLIQSIEQLKKAIRNEHHEFAITLNGGLKSCKYIEIIKSLNPHQTNLTSAVNTKKKIFRITNGIDDSEQSLSEKDIFDEDITSIGIAMKQNAFYIDE